MIPSNAQALKIKNHKKLYKKCYLETSSRPFLILSRKESVGFSILIWSNLNSFAIAYLISVNCFKKFHFSIEVVLKVLEYLQKTKTLKMTFFLIRVLLLD